MNFEQKLYFEFSSSFKYMNIDVSYLLVRPQFFTHSFIKKTLSHKVILFSGRTEPPQVKSLIS